jgi:MFS family permease
MQALDYTASTVASTATVSGLVAIPVTLALGALADRWGHKRVLILGYAVTAGGAATLLVAAQLWQFWLAAILLMVARCVNFSVASAFATSMLPPESLGRALPRINSMDSFASIISFAGTGFAMEMFGGTALYITAAALAAFATVQLGLLGRTRARRGAIAARDSALDPVLQS